MVHSFTWSTPPPNPIPVTLILYSSLSPFLPLLTPATPSLSLADGGSFVHQHPGNNIKGLLGVNAECLKNKTKLKNKEVPEGMGDIHNSTPEREEKELLCTGGNKEIGRGERELKTKTQKERKKKERKEEKRKKHTLTC